MLLYSVVRDIPIFEQFECPSEKCQITNNIIIRATGIVENIMVL